MTGLKEHEIAAALSRLATQMEHVQAGQSANNAEIKRLALSIDRLAAAQARQRNFFMGVAATLSVIGGFLGAALKHIVPGA